MQRSQNEALQAERTASTEILQPAEQAWSIQGALGLNDQGGSRTRDSHRGRQGALQARARIWGSIPHGKSWAGKRV